LQPLGRRQPKTPSAAAQTDAAFGHGTCSYSVEIDCFLWEIKMDLLVLLIILLLLFGGGGGLYWGLGAGWGIGPIGLIVAVIVVAYLLNGYRGRRGPPL
jgi:hypothetical protein